MRKRNDVRRLIKQEFDVLRPALNCDLPFGEVFMPIVHTRDAADPASGMVQDAIDDVRGDAERRHSGSGRPAEVMERKRRYLPTGETSHRHREPLSCAGETANRALTGRGEQKLLAANSRLAAKDFNGLRREIDQM